LDLNYPTTKGKVYSEEEDHYLLCCLNYYGMTADMYEQIKKNITEFPVLHFDWFFKSQSLRELQRCCNTLLGMIKEAEVKQQEEIKAKVGARGKVNSIFIIVSILC
jgi:SWI/SNF-related matrix-associated actin-dependent regulator of chromatin subfamily A member 5